MAFIGCDGPSFRISSRIIESSNEHSWALPVPGLGHLHMNQLKTFFKVCDNILFDVLGKEALKFVTPKAYAYFLNAKDAHKSF